MRSIAGRIGRVVRVLVRATSLDIGLPGTVTVSVDPGKALDEMSEEPDDAAASPQSLYYGAFQELTAAFSDVKNADLSRIIVFVDDLDRCLPERALTVLESMKLRPRPNSSKSGSKTLPPRPPRSNRNCA